MEIKTIIEIIEDTKLDWDKYEYKGRKLTKNEIIRYSWLIVEFKEVLRMRILNIQPKQHRGK